MPIGQQAGFLRDDHRRRAGLAFALWLQLTYEPPLWVVHLVVTLPLVLAACLALLRPLKGWLVCSQYFHKAEEGSIDREWHTAEAERKNRPSQDRQ